MKTNITLESTLQEHIEIFTKIVANYQLNEFEQGIFDDLKDKYQTGHNPSESTIDSLQLFNIENNDFTKDKNGGNFLSTQELINAKNTGIFGPRKLELSESLKDEVLSYNDILDEELMSDLVPAWHAHLWCPSFISFIENNYDQILQVTQSIFGDDSNLYMNAGIYVVRPGENGLRPLHKDYATLNTINLYIALSDIDENSSPVVLFPGTYKDNGGIKTYIQSLVDSGLEEEFNLIVKSIAIAQAAVMTKKILYFCDGIIPNTSLHLLSKYKYALKNTIDSDKIIGEVFKQNTGEFIIFPANIWHQSVSSTQHNKNTNTESRIVLTIRVMRDSDFCNNLEVSFRNSFNRHLVLIANYFELELNNLKEILLGSYEENRIKLSVLFNKNCDEQSCITLQRLCRFHDNMRLKSALKKIIPEITKCLVSPASGSKSFVINNTVAHANVLILGFNKLKGDCIQVEGFSSQPELKMESFLGFDKTLTVSFPCSTNKIYIYNCNDDIDLQAI